MLIVTGMKVQVDLTAPCAEAGHVWAEDGPRPGTCVLCGEERDPSA